MASFWGRQQRNGGGTTVHSGYYQCFGSIQNERNLVNQIHLLCSYVHSSWNFSLQLNGVRFQWNFSWFPKKSSSLQISLVFLSFLLAFPMTFLVFTVNVGSSRTLSTQQIAYWMTAMFSMLVAFSDFSLHFTNSSLAVTEFSFDFNISKCSWVQIPPGAAHYF